MRYARHLSPEGPLVGVVDDDDLIHPVGVPGSSEPLRSLVPLLDEGKGVLTELVPVGRPVPVADTRLLPPVVPRRNVFCVGKNYRAHAAEFARSGFDASDPASGTGEAAPSRPVVFTKCPESLIGSGADIDPHPALTQMLDYEGELVVIIGKGGRGIPAERALEHVFGYTLFNDVTARDLQKEHKQWFLGKSLDTFGPIGPYAVTADGVDLASLRLTTTVNGEKRQDAVLADLLFDIPTLIATISAGITLQPGDLIATGTPEGVGIGFDPPRFLSSDDLVEVSAPGLGVLTNRVAEQGGPA